MNPLIASILDAHLKTSGGSIVETPTADQEPGREPSSVTLLAGGSSRCICAHPGQHAECSPCRCQEKTP